MIDPVNLDACIDDMIKRNHVMEECEYHHPSGVYRIKFKKLKKKTEAS